ncbi:FAD-dependent oxidoreductase [Parasphingorhabdus flavimaris]|uniref:FAD-dependent oxidoreductase n=1 Tax=Parasphingorhabdus flavimaris TaxID=266812 RepID=A0ABX2N475_9SPHN|nr:bifunctional TVP38/TMEM64 family protein/FAD-dependent oxidoreductase [Parasphingorhabdus flavimaris]NVD28503.1 FAD-dependent oxidoreductase [Parasphingorhabdus flavimaris]|tara:strand:+ start:3438 stop:5588 length:2151 start_codon:yes stop_codon:yes gene_type:complete
MKKILILILFAMAVASFFYFDLGSQLTLANLKEQQAAFDEQYRAAPFLIIAIFFLVYVVTTAASLPGALILTLAAGALFGVVVGTIIVSFASSIGATIAFLSSRYLFRDAVKTRFGDRLKAIDRGVEKDGPFYLLTLRLVPVFPFFLINLLMGLTAIKARTFYIVSQIGMLLGTLVYVNAGTQLANIDEVSDIGSPGLLLSFAALGVTPWIGKWIVARIKRRKVYAGYSKPKKYDRNLVVIGAGAAGLVSSYIAATVKAKVTLVEAGEMGGDCLNYGCVPSKALIKSAKVAQQMRQADAYGLQKTDPQYSFKAVMQRIHNVIADIAPHDSVERYTDLGVDVVKGYAKIIDPWTVEIKRNDGETQRLTTRSIIVATGGAPFVPPLPGLDAVGYVTSDTLWEEFAKLDDIPKRMIILGGGPIGCELSQAFARLGAEVTQVEREDRLLGREDEDVSALAQAAQEGSGVIVRTGHDAVRCEVVDGEKRLIVSADGKEQAIAFDALVIAVGRSARLSGFGLEELGIETGRTIVTDDLLATSYPNIFAAGDVAGPYQFTHVASHQAWYASVNALFGKFKTFKADYRVIPWTTFIDPEIARVGLNEQEAKEQDIAHEVTTYQMHELDRAIAESATQGFVKVLTPPGKDRILGVTIVGDHAGELLAEYVLAMKYKLGLNKILGTIHTYPTMAEANKYAAGEWKRAHAPEGLLRWVERYHSWMRG